METRELSSEQSTESELDLGESTAAERSSTARLPFGLSVRGLQGTAAVLGFVTIVSAAVIGGALAVDSVARFDGPDGSALLEEAQLNGLQPDPAEDDAALDDGAEGSGDEDGKKGDKAASDAAPKPKSTEKDDDSGKKSDTPNTGGKQVDQVSSEKDADQPRVQQAAPLAEIGVLRNLATGQCVDLPGADMPEVGTGVNQYDCLPGVTDNQDFQLVNELGELWLRNLKTNFCLDLPGTGSVDAGAVVMASPCQPGDTDNQMFRAEPQGAGYYLVNVKSGLCLDVSGFTDDERNRQGQVLTMYTCSPDDDHIWTVG